MEVELSKSEKKIARGIIEKGLQREFEKGIRTIDKIINDWKINKIDNRDAYHKIYRSVVNYDKHIGRRYDDIRGSTYLMIIIRQLLDKVISIDEISEFNEDVKDYIKKAISLLEADS